MKVHKRMMKRHFLKPVNKFLAVSAILLMTSGAYADSLSFTMAMQMETFKADDGKDVSRMALGAVGAEYELNFSRKIGMGIFGGAQTSLISQENLSFGLGGFVNYYFKGNPVRSEFETGDAYINGLGRTAYFAGFGIEERFLKSSELDSEIRGGPFLRFGGRYIWNSKIFFSGNFKYLLGGEDYSSIDINLGLGFFI